MTFYFAAKTLGFLSSNIHGRDIPANAVEISKEAYDTLMSGQANGWRIAADEAGHPVLLESLPLTDDALRHVISTRRFGVETVGVKVRGVVFSSARDSQGLIGSVAHAALLDPGYRCNWKTQDGFVELNAQQILDMAASIRKHVQACFDREAELLAHLEGGTFTESMLDEGWPV